MINLNCFVDASASYAERVLDYMDDLCKKLEKENRRNSFFLGEKDLEALRYILASKDSVRLSIDYLQSRRSD